jgi:hypothetical protein
LVSLASCPRYAPSASGYESFEYRSADSGGRGHQLGRRYDAVKDLVRKAYHQGKVVGLICHAGLVGISAGIVDGKRVTGSLGIKDDLVNAGATWVDEPPSATATSCGAASSLTSRISVASWSPRPRQANPADADRERMSPRIIKTDRKSISRRHGRWRVVE